jgi:DNA-binding SARP family transcriptional activator
MEFRILGPLEVDDSGRILDLGGQKQRALLAVLLLHANHVVPSSRLIDALWEEEPPETARKALQVYVSQLRKVLGPGILLTRDPGYLLLVEPGTLDLDRFEALAREARGADLPTAAAKLREGLALVRGPPLADFAAERFAQPEIARLEELRLDAIEERIEAELGLGLHTELVGELEALAAEHPLRERLQRQRMLALYRCGRQAEALEAYQAARRALVEELGIDPGRDLRELHLQILNQDPALELEARPAARAVPEAGGAFVGREPELAELMTGLDDAFAGRGRLFLLQGEPGIGKTRLADELMRRASGRRARVLVGRCWEAGGAPAYWPWTQSLRAYVRTADPTALRKQLAAGAADVAQIIPELRELLSGLPAPEPADSQAARFRLFDSTASFLMNASGERTLALVFDDLHAADESSLLLLRYVASVLRDSRILIVGTFRDLDPTVRDPLESALAELGREPVTRRIHLAGLSEQEVGRLAELTTMTVPSKQLVAELHAETEGNPLFVSEIVQLLAAEERLEPDRPAGILIPESVHAVISRRLRRLSGECRRVLSLASVFGREFGLVALERVADYTGIDKLLTVLDEAITARVVEEVPGAVGRLRFGHALTRDVLYEDIPSTHRARLHRRVAEVLEGLYAGSPDAHLAELAHHFSAAVPAADPGKAIEYARRTGDQATRLLAYEEAVRHYRMALEAFELEGSDDDLIRCELLLALGDAEAAVGDGAASKETFIQAAELGRKLEAPEQLARAALGYGGRFSWPRRAAGDMRLVPLLEEALAALGEADTVLRAGLLTRLACALRDELSPERRESLSNEAVAIARRLGDLPTLVYILMGRRLAVWAPENLDELLQIAGEIVRIADEAGEPERAADARLLRLEGYLIGGDMGGVRADLEDAARLAADARRPSADWHVEVHRSELALLEGRFADAERHIAEIARLGEAALVAETEVAVIQTFALRWARGGLGEILPDVEQIAEEQPARALYRCLLAVLDLELGKGEVARGVLEALGRDDFAVIPRDPEWMLALCLLVEVAATLGDVERTTVLYRLLEPYEQLVVVDPHDFGTGSAARSLGVAATALGRFDEAERHFRQALAMNERIGAVPWLARAQEEYARMLVARDGSGDSEDALELIGSAVATYRELGMDSYAARASLLALEVSVATR